MNDRSEIATYWKDEIETLFNESVNQGRITNHSQCRQTALAAASVKCTAPTFTHVLESNAGWGGEVTNKCRPWTTGNYPCNPAAISEDACAPADALSRPLSSPEAQSSTPIERPTLTAPADASTRPLVPEAQPHGTAESSTQGQLESLSSFLAEEECPDTLLPDSQPFESYEQTVQGQPDSLPRSLVEEVTPVIDLPGAQLSESNEHAALDQTNPFSRSSETEGTPAVNLDGQDLLSSAMFLSGILKMICLLPHPQLIHQKMKITTHTGISLCPKYLEPLHQSLETLEGGEEEQ
ncbi:hypothetical protein ElyMa_001342300 [Elysia marginata]|uniref:Uncharacterized protein n=1 Tax=Elysia marginata TaxID=1093978 RepID=A0AAV4IRB1_9GAST|nr:hypothetical protein ElyMa_001342300 [Elysia marginata]